MKIKMIPLVAIVVSSLVLVGCGPKTVPTSLGGEVKEEVGEEKIMGSLKDLLGMGKKVMCSWEYDDAKSGSKVIGQVWVDGKRSKTETTTEVNQKVINMSFLTDGEMAWMWEEDKPQGFKYNVAEMEQEQGVNEGGGGMEAVNRNWSDDYEYKCKGWRVDESVFTVPTEIEFVDMAQQVKQAQEQTENMKQNMKGVCDSLPEPAKSECQESL